MTEAKLVSLPLGSEYKLSGKHSPLFQDEFDKMSKIPYANTVRAFMYFMVCSRSDLTC